MEDHACDVALCREGQVVEGADAADVLGPTGVLAVDGLECRVDGGVARDVFENLPFGSFVSDTDEQFAALPSALLVIAEGVHFIDHEVLAPTVADGVAFLDRIIPADHALATRGDTEFNLTELDRERVLGIHPANESVGADLGVVGLADSKGVHVLDREPEAEEKLRGDGVRGGDVWREAEALVEPVGLAELTDDVFTAVEGLEAEFADVADLRAEVLAGLPVDLCQDGKVELAGRVAFEAVKVEFVGWVYVPFDEVGICPLLGGREDFEEAVPCSGIDSANMSDRLLSALHPLFQLGFEGFSGAEEV